MPCELVRPRLADLLLGALPAPEREPIEAHLPECEACCLELAALQELEEDLLAAGGEERVPLPAAPRRWTAWTGWAAAAAVLLAALLGWLRAETTARVLAGELSGYRKGAALPAQVALVAARPSQARLPCGSLLEVGSNADLVLEAARAVRLRRGSLFLNITRGNRDFQVLTPRGTARVLGTAFEVQVKEEIVKQGAAAAAVVAVVVVTVVTGAVLFDTGDGGEPTRIAAGQQMVAGPDGVSLRDATQAPATGAPAKELEDVQAKLAAERKRWQEERAELKERIDTLEKKLQQPDPNVPEPRAVPRPRRPRSPVPLPYGKWQEVPELRTAKWREAGKGAFKMTKLIPKLVEKLAKGEQLDGPFLAQLSTHNSKLARIALTIQSKLPTNTPGPGNGEYSHPFVLVNLMVEHLAAAKLPLSETQRATILRLCEGFDQSWEQKQKTYRKEAFVLEKVLDEIALKRVVMDKIMGALSLAQRNAIADPVAQSRVRLDIYSPVLVLNARSRAKTLTSLDDLDKTLRSVARSWGLTDEQLQGQDQVFTTWAAELRPDLKAVDSHMAAFFTIDQALKAGRAQLKAMQEIALRLPPGNAKAEALSKQVYVHVPRLVKPPEKKQEGDAQ